MYLKSFRFRSVKGLCLVDGELIEKEIVLNLIIDRCSSCDSHWLDGGSSSCSSAQSQPGCLRVFGRAVTFP